MNKRPYMNLLGFIFLAATYAIIFMMIKSTLSEPSWIIANSSIVSDHIDGIEGPVFQKDNQLLIFTCSLSSLIQASNPKETIISYYSRENSVTSGSDEDGIPLVNQPYPKIFGHLKNYDGIDPIVKERFGQPFYFFDRIKVSDRFINIVFFPYQNSNNLGLAICYISN